MGGFARRGSGLLAVSISATIAGCSPTPPLVGSSGPQANGTYVLSAEEEWLDCQQLAELVRAATEQMQAVSLRTVEKMKSEPNTVGTALNRLAGVPRADEAADIAEHDQWNAKSVALTSAMVRKGCPVAKPTEVAKHGKSHKKLL